MTGQSTKDRLGMEKLATIDRPTPTTSMTPRGSTLAFERARMSTLLGQGRAYLNEIEQAQDRLAAGSCRSAAG